MIFTCYLELGSVQALAQVALAPPQGKAARCDPCLPRCRASHHHGHHGGDRLAGLSGMSLFPSEAGPGAWKVLIVNDDEQIHAVTKMVLGDFRFRDRWLAPRQERRRSESYPRSGRAGAAAACGDAVGFSGVRYCFTQGQGSGLVHAGRGYCEILLLAREGAYSGQLTQNSGTSRLV